MQAQIADLTLAVTRLHKSLSAAPSRKELTQLGEGMQVRADS
jgi:hypothetical protein